jgi:hypothetical protein
MFTMYTNIYKDSSTNGLGCKHCCKHSVLFCLCCIHLRLHLHLLECLQKSQECLQIS